MADWGLFPDDARGRLKGLEWDNARNFRDRLKGARTGTMQVNLRAPTGRQALADLERFHQFVAAWQAWPFPSQIGWERRRFHQLGEVSIPTRLTVRSIQELIDLVGKSAQAKARHWQEAMAPLLQIDESLYPILVDHLSTLERLTPLEADVLGTLLPQLKPDFGRGLYQRALPVTGVHTKFIEQYEALVTSLLDHIHGGSVSKRGGLGAWLGSMDPPSNWILTRPLCDDCVRMLGGFSVLQLDSKQLVRRRLPAERIIVVENPQSGLGLPRLSRSIAVMGGGNNLSWMNNDWLADCEILYWGDIDSWGYHFLSRARAMQGHVQSVLMNHETAIAFKAHMVTEPEPNRSRPANLTDDELRVFDGLAAGAYPGDRLEQEKIAQDFIHIAFESA